MNWRITTLLMAIIVLSATNFSHAQIFGKRPTMIIGRQQPEQLAKNDQQSWFSAGMSSYRPIAETIAALKQNWTPEFQIIAFAGSWCPDTHRELPAFFKVLQEANIPDESVKLYFLNRKMNSGTGEESKYQINSVPTFIILKNGIEIGRIKEKPGKPAEELLLDIIN